MTTSHFTSPELSAKLQKIGVQSQFDYWWCKNNYGFESESYQLFFGIKNTKKYIQAFHFSDLLLPENAKRIWGSDSGKWIEKTEILLGIIQRNFDFQEWLSEELDKRV